MIVQPFFLSDLVGNPEDRFSHIRAHVLICPIQQHVAQLGIDFKSGMYDSHIWLIVYSSPQQLRLKDKCPDLIVLDYKLWGRSG